MRDATTPEAARLQESLRNRAAREAADRGESYDPYDEGPFASVLDASQEDQERLLALYDEDTPALLFEHLLDLLARQEWAAAGTMLTYDASLVDHTDQVSASGREPVLSELRHDVAEAMQRCAKLHCTQFSYTVEPVVGGDQSPTAVFRVVEHVETADGRHSRRLQLWMVMLRPHDDPQRPLAHSQLAVLERLSAPLAPDYHPPTELVDQRQRAARHAAAYEQHWQGLHERAMQEDREDIARQLRWGTVNPDHWEERVRRHCARLRERGETPPDDFSCQDAATEFARLHREQTEQARLRARRLGRQDESASSPRRRQLQAERARLHRKQ